MIETKFGKCNVVSKKDVVTDEAYEYVGFSWVTKIDPIYGKEEHGYLVYKKDNNMVAFRGYEPSVGGID